MSLPQILYENIYSTGTITVTSTDSSIEFDKDNIFDWRTYTLWKASSSANQSITVDNGSARTVNILAIMSHNLFTAGSTISVESSSDNFSGDTTSVLSGFTVTTNRVILKDLGSPASKRYWRVNFNSNSTATFAGIIALGDKLEFPFPLSNNNNFDPLAHTIKSESLRSQTGNHLGSSSSFKELTLTPTWEFLSQSFVDGGLATFYDTHASELTPFFWSWDLSNRSTEVFLVALPPNFSRNFPFAGTTRNISFTFKGILEL